MFWRSLRRGGLRSPLLRDSTSVFGLESPGYWPVAPISILHLTTATINKPCFPTRLPSRRFPVPDVWYSTPIYFKFSCI